MTDFLKLSKDAFEASTSYVDKNYRGDWDYSIKAFRNEHAANSKYSSSEYQHRSRLFRPKTRSIIRKNEAAASVAFFSNMDVVNLEPSNPDDVMSVASAAAQKAVLQHRLTKTIPWFETCMGAIQDAQVQGAVCSYQYWEYQEKNGKKVKDKPCIELRPIENIRLDPSASWIDPVNTSPYFVDIIPMYVCDVQDMMTLEDPKTQAPKWKKFDEKEIAKAKPEVIDRTMQARSGGQQDPYAEAPAIAAFDTVWVMRWFMRDKGDDYTYYTLGTEQMLTDPAPVSEVYFHGHRPYVMGYVVLETHRTFKSSIATLTRPIQQEANEIANQRIDNVKFVLNKRWLVARGRQVDVQSLVRNVPGGVTLLTDPATDIKESNWPDVTSSAYAEQDRLNVDFDELAGNFSASSVSTNRTLNETVGGMRMLNQGASMMSEYLLATFRETWVEKVLRQLVLLEAYYETDPAVLAVAAQNARLLPRFGLSNITDEMLLAESNLTVNVGLGATNPKDKLQNFLMATQAAIGLIKTAPPTLNAQEAIKEIYSNAGYRDGARFWQSQMDPRLAEAMSQLQKLQGVLQSKQLEQQGNAQIAQIKAASEERIKTAEIQVNAGRIQGDLQIRASEIEVDKQRLELEKLKLAMEAEDSTEEQKLKMAEISSRIDEARLRIESERMRIANETQRTAHEMERAAKEDLVTESNENRVGQVAGAVGETMRVVAEQIQSMQQELLAAREGIADIVGIKDKVGQLGAGLTMVAGSVASMAGKKKMKGIGIKKGEGRKAVVVKFDDGSEEEMPVEMS